MATLTTSWKTYSSSSYSTGPSTVTFYLQARYTSQSTANNTTHVETRLRYSITKGNDITGAGYKFTCTYASTVSGSGVYTFSGTDKTITSGSKNVTHKTDGTQTISLAATAYNKYWGFNKSMSATVSLPTIARKATITLAYSFNELGRFPPEVHFTNPANFNLYLGIDIIDKNNHGVYTIETPVAAKYKSPYYFDLTDEWDSLLQSATTQDEYKARYYIQTMNGSSQIGLSTYDSNFYIVNAAPTFNATYQDTNPATIAITGDNQKIIRNQSTLQFNITDAEAKEYATLSSLEADVNGNIYAGTLSGSTGTINVGTVDLSENDQSLVRLTDSRGITVTAPIIVQVLDWQLPTASITLERQNNFYSETDITVDANYSSLDGLNTIDIKVRTKKTTDSTYGSYTSLSDNVTTTLTLDNLYEWDVQVLVTDRLGSTTYNLQIGKGMPIIYFDRLNRSVGVDCFPVNQETLEIKNQDVYKLFPVVLYDNQSGSNATITLSDDTSNYSYLEIFFGWSTYGHTSVRYDVSNSDGVNLTTHALNNSRLYWASSKWTATGNQLVLDTGEYWSLGTTGSGSRNTNNRVYIYKVLGYK